MRIGVMGGTFDPVHLGHLAIVESACSKLGLSEVLFMPAGHPYFKAATFVSPSADRVEMLRLALERKRHYKISMIEIERTGPSYAIDSVARLKDTYRNEDEIYFIMGLDSLLTLPRWQEPERLLELCRIVAAPRPGFSRPDLDSLEKDLPGVMSRTIVLEGPLIDISSSDIRQRVSQGLPITGLVPEKVEKYIREHRLYLDPGIGKK
jgi:nicotinate-nucleotide adenylyltransferase